jgi:cell wall-associated NlpC family hydrolase
MISQPASPVRLILVFVAGIMNITACSSQQPQSDVRQGAPAASTSHGSARELGDRAAKVAASQVGVPYRYGGSTPSGFDCSGLVYYSYAQIGVSVPRTTGQLWKGVAPIDKSDLRAGDVLFFRISGKVAHVGLYLGKNQFVHAPSSGKKVTVQSLQNDFYKSALVGIGRPD